MNSEERQIFERLRIGDERALHKIFNAYHLPLCVFALKYLDDFDKAEDVVQEVFVSFWEKKSFENINQSIKSYLFKAVKNRVLRILEKENKIFFTDIEECVEVLVSDSKDDESNFHERKEKLLKELDNLPPKTREVLEYIVFGGMRYKEVAEELDVSVNTIKSQFTRALRMLRSSLDTIFQLLYL